MRIFLTYLFNVIINSVLAASKLRLLALNQQLKLLSSGDKACLRSVNVLAGSVMFVSSANILGAAACSWGDH